MLELSYRLPVSTSGFQALRNEYRTEDENYLRYALKHGFDTGAELNAAPAVNTTESAECAGAQAANVA